MDVTPVKLKRNHLTLLKKVEIIKFYESISLNKDAKLKTMINFKIKSRSSLNTILKNKQLILNTYNDGSISKNRKTLKPGMFALIDEKVRDWVENMKANNLELSRDNIIKKANELLLKSGENVELSSGWFQGFIKRYNIKKNTFHGESNSVNNLIIENWKEELKKIIVKWNPADIYNADETGLYYQMKRSL